MILLYIMVTLINSAGIDSEKAIDLRFLPYQKRAIYTESRKNLVRKAVRIGYTYAKAFKAVRSSLINRAEDTLFTTKDQATSFEFIETCKEHIEHFNQARSVIAQTEEQWDVPVFDELGKDLGVTEKVTVSKIVFDNKSRILSFSSNPNALRAYGGNVMWDEAAFHLRGREMWAAIQGRARWNYVIDVWSSLAISDTMFDVLASTAEKGKGGWDYEEINIHDAIKAGLVELINQQRGGNKTREEFLEECKEDCVLPDLFALEYELKKENTLSPIVEFEKLKACEKAIRIEREHLSDERVIRLFGRAQSRDMGPRRRAVESFLDESFPALLDKRTKGKRFRIGFDVAASRKGDLASIWIDEKIGSTLRHRALLTFRTEDWDVMEWTMQILFAKLPGEVKGAGDETGLGRQICWNMAKLHHGRFTPVNFSGKKQAVGIALMTQLSGNLCELSSDHPDVTNDIYCIRKGIRGDQVYFFESRNDLIPESHADIGWSKALAAYVDVVNESDLWVLNQ